MHGEPSSIIKETAKSIPASQHGHISSHVLHVLLIRFLFLPLFLVVWFCLVLYSEGCILSLVLSSLSFTEGLQGSLSSL